MTVKRMDHAGVVAENLAAAITFFVELVGEVAEYEDVYRYGYLRGPGGVIIGLVEELR